MAHRSYLSPDGKQMLVVEMNFCKWLPCRLVPFDGSSTGNRFARRRPNVLTRRGPLTASGCTSPPIPAADFTFGGSLIPAGKSNRSLLPVRRRKRESSLLWTGALLSRLLGPARARCGFTMRAATEKGQIAHRVPRFLPDGRRFLYLVDGADPAIWISSLDGGHARRVTTITSGTDSAAEYLMPGWLIRVRQNALVAQPFDANSGQLEETL